MVLDAMQLFVVIITNNTHTHTHSYTYCTHKLTVTFLFDSTLQLWYIIYYYVYIISIVVWSSIVWDKHELSVASRMSSIHTITEMDVLFTPLLRPISFWFALKNIWFHKNHIYNTQRECVLRLTVFIGWYFCLLLYLY